MTSRDDQHPVTKQQVDAAKRVPGVFVRTFGWDVWFWANQENGTRSGPAWAPGREEVERMLNGECDAPYS